jgi:hypothetical protein
MSQPSLYTSDESRQYLRVKQALSNIHETVELLHARNKRLRRIVTFQALALALAFIGLASLADWRVTAAFYGISLCYLPFFAKR